MFYENTPFFDIPGQSDMRRNVNTTELYDTLGVEKTATADEIKRAFRKKALHSHPDRGGDEEVFKALSEAYEILSDDEKRTMYDKYGKEGVSNDHASAVPDFGDIFGSVFGHQSNRRSGGKHRTGKSATAAHQLRVKLVDLYCGKEFKLRITRRMQKNPDDVPEGCGMCGGSGVTVSTRRMGPMVQQMQSTCRACGGKGHGNVEMVTEKKVVVVTVEKGMTHGTVIRCPACADQEPGCTPGDLNVTLVEEPHDTFRRKGTHLLIKQSIGLVDALCGARFSITHLDGRSITLSTPPGRIITPSCTWFVEGEGMPIRHTPFNKGHLFVQFDIHFPTSLDEEARQSLRSALPSTMCKQVSSANEEYEMVGCNIDAKMKDPRQHASSEAYDSDHDEEGERSRPKNVQCSQS